MKMIMVSGYKSFELGIFDDKHPGLPFVKKAIENRLRIFIEEGLEWVFISGQIGVELWTGEIVLELKKEFPQLKLAVVTPFLDQEKRWKEETQEFYHQIVSQADFVKSASGRGYEGGWQFQQRDKAVMDKTDGLLLLYDDENEGSPKYLKEKAIKYSESRDYELHFIDSYDLQAVVEEEQDKNRTDW